MSRIVHHLPEELMLGYASGRCGEGEALLVATHLTLCPRCRGEVAELEALGGALLSRLPEEAVSSELLATTLSRLDEAPHDRQTPAVTPPAASDPVLPRPLLQYTGPLSGIAWQSRFFGLLRFIELPISTQGVPVRLKRIRRSADIPRHLHRGLELEIYLAGGAHDTGNGKRYARGDVSVYDSGEPHELKVDPEEDCILLCVHSAPLLPANLFGRVVYGLLGWT